MLRVELYAISSNSSLVLDKLYIVSAINQINCSHTCCCEADVQLSQRSPDQSMHTPDKVPGKRVEWEKPNGGSFKEN